MTVFKWSQSSFFQSTSLTGFDKVYATPIFTTYFRSIFSIKQFLHIQGRDILPLSDSSAPYKYVPRYQYKYILLLLYWSVFVFFQCLDKLSFLISMLHVGHCILKGTLESTLFWGELLFLTIFGCSDVLVKHEKKEKNSFSFGDCFYSAGLENNSFSSGDLFFLIKWLFKCCRKWSFCLTVAIHFGQC